jgi:hypothetical protein
MPHPPLLLKHFSNGVSSIVSSKMAYSQIKSQNNGKELCSYFKLAAEKSIVLDILCV